MRPILASLGLNRLLLGTAVLLALSSWWLRQMIEEHTEQHSGVSHTPDYWVEHLSARTMDNEGRLQRILEADQLRHFPDDDSSELSKPKIVFLEPSEPTWQILAETALVAANGDLALLKGAVTIDREKAIGMLPVHLATRDLRVQPKDEYAETDQPVQMLSGHTHIQALGLRAWLKKPVRIILPAQVRAHYEVTQ